MDALPILCLCWTLTGAPEYDPPPRDLMRFPLSVVDPYVAFSQRHLDWLDGQCLLRPSDTRLIQWQMDAKWCKACWDELKCAAEYVQQYEEMECSSSRALGRLRDLIGREAFNEGRMPPPVPIWHFRKID